MSKRKLFTVPRSDFRLEAFAAGGPGGQNQNKTATGVRITHLPSGAVGEARDERSQYTNRRLAFLRLTESGKFKRWLARRVWEVEEGQAAERRVEQALAPGNLLIEGVDEQGRWAPLAADAKETT